MRSVRRDMLPSTRCDALPFCDGVCPAFVACALFLSARRDLARRMHRLSWRTSCQCVCIVERPKQVTQSNSEGACGCSCGGM
jgi:hypothetical protein